MLCVVIYLLSAAAQAFASLTDYDFRSEQVNTSCSTFSKDQWECRDGSCISLFHRCDGIVHCLDGSDESHAVCGSNKCEKGQFRCTYGACVDGTAPCNGFPACADNSDELLPICRNDQRVKGRQFECFDGTTIPSVYRCDGIRDCGDGSDEVLWTCAAEVCPPHWFQCAYGACVETGAECNEVRECADGSDEDETLCNKYKKYEPQFILRSQIKKCVLPPYPTHGTYVTLPDAKPGDALQSVDINITCHDGHGVNGASFIDCYDGLWSADLPQCVKQCQLTPHPSVEYLCSDSNSSNGSRPCNEYELESTVVTPSCRGSEYFSPDGLSEMHCINGNWTHVATCLTDCGRFVYYDIELHNEFAIIGGTTAALGEAPWHAGIYTKTTKPFKHICGGSIISKNLIISAAHCFWSSANGEKLPVTNYAVAAGKMYRPWDVINSDRDFGTQRNDVKKIHLPVRFQGSVANYQDDIAVVEVAWPFTYTRVIRPVCVDFTIVESELNKSYGKVAGWGLTDKTSWYGSPILSVLQMPYVDTETCIIESPPSFRPFITSDKFCAGYKGSNKAVCRGDSGGGLVFPRLSGGQTRYFLHGVVSTAPDPDNEDTCNDDTYTAFTDLQSHERFIKQFWNPKD